MNTYKVVCSLSNDDKIDSSVRKPVIIIFFLDTSNKYKVSKNSLI